MSLISVQYKIIFKRSCQKNYIFICIFEISYLLKLLKIELSTNENLFIVLTIGLLLQVHNSRCTLHNLFFKKILGNSI